MCEPPYDNYSAFEGRESERCRIERMNHNSGMYCDCRFGEGKINSPGYSEIGTGIFVPEEDACRHALERVSLDEGLKQEFVEWFYSGNWVREG